MQYFVRKKYGREIINYDIIKLLLLSSQSRKFHKFLFAQLIAATEKMFVKFRIVFAFYLREQKCEISQKVCEI